MLVFKNSKVLFILIFVIHPMSAFTQGLEKIIVEEYYKADNVDSIESDVNLATGTVTYRIFADLLPGYTLQAVYGSDDHPLIISTSTSFYNHPNYGNYIPNLIPDYSLKYNTVMLDSWISMGAASQGSYGIPITDDDTIKTIANNNQLFFLKNDTDGLHFNNNKPPRVTVLNIDSLLVALDKITFSTKGFYFNSQNCGWATLEGATGPYPEINKVLIGQFTTSGNFMFSINLQLGKPGGGIEKYVASNPSDKEIFHQDLTYSTAR